MHTELTPRRKLDFKSADFKSGLLRALISIVLALLLLAIFVAYLRPSFMLELANHFILC